jgi:ASC-1-like (ASCH) protein
MEINVQEPWFTLKKTLPGVPTIKCGVRVYREFYDENKEKEFGVLAITLKNIK